MKKLYISGPENRGEGSYHILTDEGEHLASHYCSHAGYAKDDLHDRRSERKEEWKKRFGEYKVLWLGEDEMTKDKLVELNKNFGGLKKEELPSVTLVVEDENGKEQEIKKIYS